MSFFVGGAIVGSAIIGKKSADRAGDISSAGTDAQIAEQRRQFDINQANQEPFRQAGVNALGQLEQGIGQFNPELPQFDPGQDFNFNLQEDPGFIFARDQALKAANRGQAQLGGFNSGNRLAELSDRATGVASQFANDAFNRQQGTFNTNFGKNLTDFNAQRQRSQDLFGRDQTRLNRLSSLAGVGQTATNQLGAAGQNTANQISGAIGQNTRGQINALNAGTNQITGGIGNLLTAQQLGLFK